MIKRKIIPVTAILIIVICIFFHQENKRKQLPVSYTLFRTEAGWGYNILVNDSIFIHQENIPAVATNKAFDTELHAKTAAEIVVQKIKVNKNPMLSESDVETIFLDKGQLNGK